MHLSHASMLHVFFFDFHARLNGHIMHSLLRVTRKPSEFGILHVCGEEEKNEKKRTSENKEGKEKKKIVLEYILQIEYLSHFYIWEKK